MTNNTFSVQSNLKNVNGQQTENLLKVSGDASSSKTKQATQVTSQTVVVNANQNSADARKQREEQAQALKEKVAELNNYVQHLNRKLQFSVDDTSGDTIVKVIDSDTDELIRQIPEEKLLEVKNALEEYRGILFETKA
jgi:flagellar protein FlaG